jgi:hypothetical protein
MISVLNNIFRRMSDRMKAYRFETKISKTGTIQIPFTPDLYNSDVEVIILPKIEKNIKPGSAREFVGKWSGFLGNDNTDNANYKYLSEKYK